MKCAFRNGSLPLIQNPLSQLGLVAGILLSSLMFFGGCKDQDKMAISAETVALLPAVPDLSAVPAVFEERVQAAAAIAQSDSPTLDSVKALARLYHANGYLQEAMACYEALLTLEPENPRWKHLFAFILSTYGYADDAEILWTETIELEADYIPSKIRLADVFLKSNRLEEANELYSLVLSQESKNPYALLGLARVAIAKEDWQSAKSHLEAASRYSAGKIGKDLLVTVYENLGDLRRAQILRGEAKASGSFVDIPDPWLAEVMIDCFDPAQLMNMGGLAAFGGDHIKGIEWSKRALEIDPENPLAHFQIAEMYYQTGKLAKAFEHYKLATQYKPDFSDAWLKMMEIEKSRGNEAGADEVFYTGFMKCPNSPAYNLQYAMRLMKEGARRQAMGYLERSIELNPNEAAAYIQLASNYFALNQLTKARDSLVKALDVEPGNALAMLTLCYFYISSGDQANANKWMDTIEAHPRIEASDKLDMRLKYQEAF